MIEGRNIEKSFGENHVLHDISCRFHTGKTNLIIGQSGSGKNSTDEMLVGLFEVDSGQVFTTTVILQR